MRAPQPRRRARTGERGLTLIEMIVTIAIITLGVVGIAGGVASVEKAATVDQSQAGLEVSMRQLTDFVRSDLASPNGLTYAFCATPSTYQPTLTSTAPSGVTWTVASVVKSTAATRNGAGVSAHTSCGSGVGDWGVQELTVTLTSGGRSLTRVVWKADT